MCVKFSCIWYPCFVLYVIIHRSRFLSFAYFGAYVYTWQVVLECNFASGIQRIAKDFRLLSFFLLLSFFHPGLLYYCVNCNYVIMKLWVFLWGERGFMWLCALYVNHLGKTIFRIYQQFFLSPRKYVLGLVWNFMC